MKTLQLILFTFALLQVACSDKEVSQAQSCLNDTACANQYASVSNISALGGAAAAAGLPQVAGIGTSVQQGQVPNVAVLPASITNAQLRAEATRIASQIKTLNGEATTSAATVSGVSAATPASVTASDIGIASGPAYGLSGGDIAR